VRAAAALLRDRGGGSVLPDAQGARGGPAEVVALGARGLYEIALSVQDHWTNIEALLKKYANRPISLADACLIRCAEVHDDARILTFDSDFRVYRWARNRRFDVP
jgi:predicted nucleic acid-binding protein